MGATTGIVGATVVTLGLLTLPTLLRRKYDKGLACGIICASGTLGQIIPPSLILILLADILNESVGTLFAAAMIPGLMLAGIYVVYLLGLGIFRPHMVPAVPQDERDLISRGELAGKLLRVVLPPIALVGAVLGSIIAGIAAPTEAASMGALGAIVVTAIGGRMSWAVLRDTTYATTRITAMMMFILMCAQAFSLAFRGLQGEKLVQDFFAFLPGGTSGAIWFLMFIIFILGFFIEWIEISYIAVPLFLPIFIAANVDMVWLATLICVNLQTSFLTPPFGWALFFLRGVAPPEVTTGDIYRGIVPFVAMQLIALVLCFFFPGSRIVAAEDDRLVSELARSSGCVPAHRRGRRARRLDRVFDIDLAGLREFQRGFDLLALFERLLQSREHHVERSGLEFDGLTGLDLEPAFHRPHLGDALLHHHAVDLESAGGRRSSRPPGDRARCPCW